MLTALALALVLAAPPPPPPPGVALAPASARPGSDGRLIGDWPSQPAGAKVTLKERKLTVDKALKQIADAAGWSLVANTGRAGDRMLVVDLRDVPVEDALVAVLGGTPLAATRRGNTVTVAPQALPVAEAPVLSGFDAPSGKKVTANFSDVGIDKALRQIAEAAGWSIVLPPGLRGGVNASFKGTPVEEALKAVLSQAGLSATRDGSIVTITRTSGPRVVIRGERRRLVFDAEGDLTAEDAKGIAEDARAAAAEAMADAQADLADAQADAQADGKPDANGRKRDKVISGDVVIGPGERWRDVVALRGNVRLGAGSSARQVTAVLGSVELEPGATVDREVVAVGGNVHVASGANVGRDAVSIGGDISIDQGGVVDGQEVSVSVPGVASLVGLAAPASEHAKHISTGFKIGQALAKYVVFFLLGLLLLAVAPARLDRVTASLSRSPVKDLLVGVLGTVAMPVLTVLLVVTIVGILLVPVQLIAILVAGILGYTALALLVGRALPIRTEKATSVIQLAVGVGLVVLVSEIPYVGAMAMITAWFLVFGAVLRSRGGQPSPAAPAAPSPTTSIAPTTPA
jgi:hypothetical protein